MTHSIPVSTHCRVRIVLMAVFRLASLPGPSHCRLQESHRAWYLKSRDQLTSLSGSKDGCVSLHFTGDFVSVVSLWHKWAVKKSYKKCRFATFIRCLKIAIVLTHACNYLSTTSLACARDFRYQALGYWPAHVTLDTRPCDTGLRT